MKKTPYSVNTFEFRENDGRVITQQFNGTIKIEGFTEYGKYKFEYQEWENNNIGAEE